MRAELSARQGRRIALAAQGLAAERPRRAAGKAQLRGLVRRLGAIQIDSVNVLVRTHYLPAFSRLGAYPRDLLEREAWGARPSLFEYWGHEASLLPIETQPLFRWRMERARAGQTWGGLARFASARRGYIDEVLARVESEGPLTGGDFADGPRTAGWWSWSDGKRALEWLFWAGLITTRTRRGFERVYDLTERVLPDAVLRAPTPGEPDAHRALLMSAAAAMGVATEADLRDYFRMPVADTRVRLAELVEAGALLGIAVEGWRQPAYLYPGAAVPRRVRARTLLSPFDNLIWRRERTERLFGARIRLEIYTPAERREHGYYVLPLLLGETIAARADLKTDRRRSVLIVQAAHLEQGADPQPTAEALAAELATMAGWLGLSQVVVRQKGGLAAMLSRFTGSTDPAGAGGFDLADGPP
ncbi:MAG: winged helix-turn-helix domain-containing protein [Caulobacteraceae bacterium]